MNFAKTMVWTFISVLSYASTQNVCGNPYDRIIAIIRSATVQYREQYHNNDSQAAPIQIEDQAHQSLFKKLNNTHDVQEYTNNTQQSVVMQPERALNNTDIREADWIQDKVTNKPQWTQQLFYERQKAPSQKSHVFRSDKDSMVPPRQSIGRAQGSFLDTPSLGKGRVISHKQEKSSFQESISTASQEKHRSLQRPILRSRLLPIKKSHTSQRVSHQQENRRENTKENDAHAAPMPIQENVCVSMLGPLGAFKAASVQSADLLTHSGADQKNTKQSLQQATHVIAKPGGDSCLNQAIRFNDVFDSRSTQEQVLIPVAINDVEDNLSDQESEEAPGRYGCLYSPFFEESESENDDLNDEEDAESVVSYQEREEGLNMHEELEAPVSQGSELPIISLSNVLSDSNDNAQSDDELDDQEGVESIVSSEECEKSLSIDEKQKAPLLQRPELQVASLSSSSDGSAQSDDELDDKEDVESIVSSQGSEEALSVHEKQKASLSQRPELQVISLSSSSSVRKDNSMQNDTALGSPIHKEMIVSDQESEEDADWQDCHSDFEDATHSQGVSSDEGGKDIVQQVDSSSNSDGEIQDHKSLEEAQKKAPQTWTEYLGTATTSAKSWLSSWWYRK